MEHFGSKDVPWTSAKTELEPMANAGLRVWQSVDGQVARAYLLAAGAPDATWTMLADLRSVAGASAGLEPAFHYVVETDVAPEHGSEFNAWYEQEHLPGLASVPGAIRAARYRRASGSPRYLACYDLLLPATLERPEWRPRATPPGALASARCSRTPAGRCFVYPPLRLHWKHDDPQERTPRFAWPACWPRWPCRWPTRRRATIPTARSS